jgi:PAS domain S-box-containing protein
LGFHLHGGPPMVTIEELRERDLPFVQADHQGLIETINPLFESVYGWSEDDLCGRSLSLILPAFFRDAHHLGFSRFQITGESQVLNHPLRLKTVCKDGREIESEHFIVAQRRGDSWAFAATLEPIG